MIPLTPLTNRQWLILRYICNSIRVRGYPPTIREIGRAFGIPSPSGVREHLNALEKKRYIERDSGNSRGMRVVSKSYVLVRVDRKCA
jgi:repressor LexA